MFDTPDLGPLCVAPFVAIGTGILVIVIGLISDVFIEKKTGKRLGWWLIIFITTFAIVPLACIVSTALDIGARDPAPWFKPSTNDIAGKWKLAAGFTDDLPKSQASKPAKELVFYKDGTFKANGIPDLWSYTDLSNLNHVSYISGSGTWYLGQVQGTQRLEWTLFTVFQEINGRTDRRTMRYFFQGHLPPYTLSTLDSGYLIFYFQRE